MQQIYVNFGKTFIKKSLMYFHFLALATFVIKLYTFSDAKHMLSCSITFGFGG